ncbi:MAG: type VI secretion system-associated FHA domain protein TagH [Rhodothermales bacterium]|nr:type VI secretion system-associated FHA domain protein TagH [Rhodothermales bacterium]
MTLQLKIVSDHRELVGDDDEREFGEEGGTIGRSLQNDWILPDPDRFISGRHATIDYKGGIYYLLDTSSNGVYINDEVEPIGKGNPRRLFNGDRMRMGDFEFTVAVDSGESLSMPLDPEPSVVPDNIEQLVDEDLPRTGVKMLDEEELTGDDEFRSVLFSTSTSPKAPPQAEPEKAAPVAKPVQKKKAGKKHKTHSRRNEDVFAAFLHGLGINRVELHPSVDRTALMLNAGHVLREFVEGVIPLLAGRANLKNTFRLDQTSVLPRHNNPLKFSESPDDLIKQLLVGDEGDYLGAKDAVREACQDLMNHQNAFLDAMNSAFIEFADRFEPDELEQGFERALSGSKLFSFGNKSKYWDLYRDLYPIMTEKGGGRFPQMFGEEFVRAYERQIAEYQRRDRERLADDEKASTDGNADMKATQKLPPLAMRRSQAPETEASNDPVSDTAVDEIDQSFIDELEDSMARDLSNDQREA